MRQSHHLFVVLGIFCGLQACGAGADAPGSEMKLHKECLETVCSARAKQNADACERCLDACSSASYNCDPSRECSYSCDSSSDCTDDTCKTEGFKVVLPVNTSPELLAACNRERDLLARCKYETSAVHCSAYAAVELPARASNYDCVAALACESLTDKDALAACDVPPSTFGDELCAKMNDKCAGSCSSGQQSDLNQEGSWLRPDAMAAATSCAAQESCSDASDCLKAFLSAVR